MTCKHVIRIRMSDFFRDHLHFSQLIRSELPFREKENLSGGHVSNLLYQRIRFAVRRKRDGRSRLRGLTLMLINWLLSLFVHILRG